MGSFEMIDLNDWIKLDGPVINCPLKQKMDIQNGFILIKQWICQDWMLITDLIKALGNIGNRWETCVRRIDRPKLPH